MLYSNTGVSGAVPGVGSDRQLVFYYWLIPNRNTEDGISIDVSWVCGLGVKSRKSLECGSNGRIVLGGDAGALVCFTGLLGCTACGGVVPSTV